MEQVKAPVIGQSVFVPFVTDGEGVKVKGAALVPFDKIDAVYSDVEYSSSGKRVYSVRLKSGDAVKIMQKDDKWCAVA